MRIYFGPGNHSALRLLIFLRYTVTFTYLLTEQVRFWECHAEGKLVAQFNAGHRPGASVTALCTDREHYHYLVTGDTDGYIKVRLRRRWWLSCF